ncbi:ankyrin repeat domain-containing protein [Lentisphaera profundi]|uniref:Ankyrin repeat domain-containing protein n=1 Tax=Lentisphaera profundi TaxID=1658616 RepID=A0ABY7VQD0_9BACT|nr:ankyrin repeat domain-containing protein [Lentisphaera profundi]WDE96396.1 ankyrin repeat domain-containing protein [Lentisphaera profundi]
MKALKRQDIMASLLVAGADPNKINDAGQTPLDISVSAGDLDSVKYLLGGGAQVVHQQSSVELHSAVKSSMRSGNLTSLKNLLKKHPKLINYRQKNGYGLVHLAVEAGSDNIIEYLYSRGLSLNTRSHTGDTPIHVAVHSGRIRTLECLMAIGASIEIPNEEGNTPLHIAWTMPKMIKILIMAGANAEYANLVGAMALHVASKKGAIAAVDQLISCGVNIKAHDFDGRRAIHVAIHYPEVMKFLIDKDADIDAKDFYGESPLHVAVQEVCFDSVKILLEAGADSSMQNHHGDTPLHFATLKGDLKVVELLLEYGSNPDIANIRGYTPLHSVALSALSDKAP